MASNTAEITFTGNAADLLSEYKKLQEANRKLEDQIATGAKTARQAAREEAAARREAGRIIKENQTALERLNAQEQRLNELAKQGHLTQTQLNRALASAREEYKRATTDHAALAEAERRRINQQKETIRLEKQKASEAKATFDETRTPLERYQAEQARLNRMLKEGRINQETFNRAMRQARDNLRGAHGGAMRFASSLGNIVSGIVGGAGVLSALNMWKQANSELIEQANEIGAKYDGMFRKFRVQSGLRGLEAESAQQNITQIAAEVGVPVEQATEAATQLVSSGFSAQEASGGSLREFLRVLSASNIRGAEVDPATLAKSFSQFLSAEGLPKTAENVANVGQSAQLLFKGTNFQIPQLTDLAKEASSFSSLVPLDQQLGAFASLVQRQEAPQAATGLRNIIGRLSTARESAPRREGLARLGLQPDEVDFIGEDLFDVLGKLRQGLDRLPEEQRAGTLRNLFEEQGVATANNLLNSMDEIRQNVVIQRDRGSFESDVAEATSGRGAAAVRQQVAEEQQLLGSDQLDDLIKTELRIIARESGRSPFVTATTGWSYDISRSLGMSQASAVWGSSASDERVTLETILERIEQRSAGASAQREQVEREAIQQQRELTDALRENTAATRNNQPGAAPRPMSAAPSAPSQLDSLSRENRQ